ncbi:hypothetical protein OJ920_11670, partial [Streptococcus anginosus]|nr:hypothetical protein [Streptococcus anginosus]
GAVTVPIYETDSAAQIEHILVDSEVTIVVTATTQQADLVRSVARDNVTIMSLDKGAERTILAAAKGVRLEQVNERLELR